MSKKDGYVLIFEDTDGDFEQMKELLKKNGYSAKQAINADDVIKMAKGSKPKVIVANLINGKRGIFSGLSECRKITEKIEVPVVCYSELLDAPTFCNEERITGNGHLEGFVPGKAAKNLGAAEYLENPLGKNMKSVLDSIKKYF